MRDPPGTPEEAHEIQALVSCRCLALNLSGPHVQRCVQRQRAVALILESVTLNATWRKRNKGGRTGRALGWRFLVLAEHGEWPSEVSACDGSTHLLRRPRPRDVADDLPAHGIVL